uniref:Retinal rod rhodopsin-sensitive cGMP 3',5'-cyclic phosphodiesterase subunit gamma n=1 Tax=Labrus bergylta TaxID=56723 RepID=A0A3Q3ERP9_9LABR
MAHPVQAEADRQFKSKPPKKGIQGIFGDDIPGMEGLGTDITVICPWEFLFYLSNLFKYFVNVSLQYCSLSLKKKKKNVFKNLYD